MKNIFQYICLVCLGIFLQVNLSAQSDQYLHFDGEDDNVVLENGSQYIANADAFSMVGWFYTDQLAYGQGMMGFRAGSSECYLIQLDNGIIECRYIPAGGFYEVVAPAFSIQPETWQHVAWIFNGTSVELFIDGQSIGSAPASGQFGAADVHLTLGESVIACCDFYYGGRIDEFSLWSKALTQAELQDMMDNEPTGDEANLEVYYKFNQGVPEEDNTSISHVISEVEPGIRDAVINNFALTGENSNFGGEFDAGFQAITFPQIPNKLTTDAPFDLNASASSGLPVSYEIVSGPASVSGNTITLDGTVGEVVVKASQAGDGTFDPATDLTNSFQVLDPNTFVPTIDARHPMAGDVFVPELSAVQLAAIANIDYPELFNVQNVSFEVEGETITPDDFENGHYTAWWTPPSYGSFDVTINATQNFGATASETITINVAESTGDINNVTAVEDVVLNLALATQTVTAELPSYQGAFNQITATLSATCPTGGCGEWDRVASIDARGKDGKWVEIIRYITPYGTACSSSIDLTDYMSLLAGKTDFRVNCVTFDNGYNYELTLDYQAGTPDYAYSSIRVLWQDTYDFGNMDNLQPVQMRTHSYPDNAEASTLKIISNGHGWGDNNTANAAEFHEDTHHIWVDGVQTFEQHNWATCNPNPDGCQPQAGTWFHNRAGWCPGAISPWFDYNMNPYIGENNLELEYVFDEDYVDMCHEANPNCISGVTCPNCDDGFNPHLIVAANLITFYNGPFEAVNVEEVNAFADQFTVYPNPSEGLMDINFEETISSIEVHVLNNLGQLILNTGKQDLHNTTYSLDLTHLPKGMYLLEVITDAGRGVQKVLVE